MKHRPTTRTNERLARLRAVAEAQGGVLHRRQLLAAGISDDAILGWTAAGWLERRFRWTFTFPGTPTSLRTTAWSAVLSVGGDAALTATHALALMELVEPRRNPLVIRSDGRPAPQAGLTVRRVGELAGHEVTMRFGPNTTTFARAILDAAGLPWWTELDRALDRSVRLELFDGRALERVIADHRRARGRSALEAAIARLDETAGRKRSELERRLVELVTSSSLPTPIVNGLIAGYEVDLHWYLTRAIVEADGRKDHISPADVARDAERRAALHALGYEILLVDWWSVTYRPAETLERIERFVAANTAPPVPRASA